MFQITWSRLGQVGDQTDVTCDDEGPKIGPIPLLRRTRLGFEPRPAPELDFIFSAALGRPIQFSDKSRALKAAAEALDKCDVARAMLITQFMWLPALPDQRALDKAVKAETLIKAGFNPTQPRDEQGQWTADEAAEDISLLTGDPNLIQAQDLVLPQDVVPWLDQIKPVRPLAPTPPFPGEILPPAVGNPDIAVPRGMRNPYEDAEGCKEEWDGAIRYCGKLAMEGKLGHGQYEEHGKYFEQCVRGQVSERCGGNAI